MLYYYETSVPEKDRNHLKLLVFIENIPDEAAEQESPTLRLLSSPDAVRGMFKVDFMSSKRNLVATIQAEIQDKQCKRILLNGPVITNPQDVNYIVIECEPEKAISVMRLRGVWERFLAVYRHVYFDVRSPRKIRTAMGLKQRHLEDHDAAAETPSRQLCNWREKIPDTSPTPPNPASPLSTQTSACFFEHTPDAAPTSQGKRSGYSSQ